MGFGDLMGTKMVFSRDYTIEELYEAIKDVPFEAGTPQLVKHGPATLIAFPQMDRNNQVQINGKKNTYYCQRSPQPVGLDKAAANMVLDSLTGGLTSWTAAFGKTKKKCEELAKKAGEQINAMHL